MQFEKLNINFNGSVSTEKWFKEFIALVPFMPALHSLIIEATEKGPINIDFVSPTDLATGGSYHQNATTRNGVLLDLKRSIKLPKDARPAKIIETLIFELCNAKNPYLQFYSPKNISTNNFNNRNDYAHAIEFAEYTHTHLEAKKVDKAVFSDQEILAALRNKAIYFSDYELLNAKTDSVRSFAHWWQVCNTQIKGKNYSHADVYRKQFDKAQGQQARAAQPPVVQPLKQPTAKPVASPQVVPNAGQRQVPQHRHNHAQRHCGGQFHAKPVTFTFTVFVGKNVQAKQVILDIEQKHRRQVFKGC